MELRDIKRHGVESIEEESELLPKEPIPPIARILSTIFIVIFFAAAIFALFVPLPAIVKGRFVLAPEGGADPVNASHAGVVEMVGVRVGSRVEKGDILFTVRSPELRDLAAERSKLVLDLETARQELDSHMSAPRADVGGTEGQPPSMLRSRILKLELELESDLMLGEELARQHQVRLVAARADAARALDEVKARESRVASLQGLLDQQQKLQENKVAAKAQILRAREELADAQADLQEARREHVKALQALESLQADWAVTMGQRDLARITRKGELAESRATLQEKVRQLENTLSVGARRLSFLDTALKDAEGDLLYIRAPFDGAVVSLAVERPEVSVERGKQLCGIARQNALLYAAIEIPENDAGHIERGQTVRLLLDAYPYTRFGVRPARLAWVSPAAREGKLPAIAILEEAVVRVGGETKPLSAGMAGEARIQTGRRTLVAYVFEPLQDIRESFGTGDGSPSVE